MIHQAIFFCSAVALATAASIHPPQDEGVFMLNGRDSWDSAMARGRGGGAMMWSGWGPSGMTAFTSTADLMPPEDRRSVVPEERKSSFSPDDRRAFSDDSSPESAHSPSGSTANASFNAWFPIVLGMLPQGDVARSNNGGGYPPVAAVANSVSHGTRGVASSHAVAYGGGGPPHVARQNPQRRL